MPSTKDRTTTVEQQALDVLRRIEARHADPSRWCKGAVARGKNGRRVAVYGKAVASTCLAGARAIETAWKGQRVQIAVQEALYGARNELFPGRTLPEINDDIGYDAVRAVERRAIEIAEQGVAP